MRTCLTIVVATLLAASTSLAQQLPSPVGVGATVRVKFVHGGTTVGVLDAVGPTALSIASPTKAARLSTAPLDSIASIDVLVSQRSALSTGAQWGKYGAMVGGGVGLLWSLLAFSEPNGGDSEFALMFATFATGGGVALGALYGGALGIMKGALFPAQRWRRVSSAELRR